LQGNQPPHPINRQIRLLRQAKSSSPLNGFGILHGRRIPAPEKKDAPHSVAHALHSEEKKLETLIGRLERWLKKPI